MQPDIISFGTQHYVITKLKLFFAIKLFLSNGCTYIWYLVNAGYKRQSNKSDKSVCKYLLLIVGCLCRIRSTSYSQTKVWLIVERYHSLRMSLATEMSLLTCWTVSTMQRTFWGSSRRHTWSTWPCLCVVWRTLKLCHNNSCTPETSCLSFSRTCVTGWCGIYGRCHPQTKSQPSLIVQPTAALSLTAGVSVEKVCTFFLFSIGIVLFIVSLLFRWRLSGCQCCPAVHQLSWNTLKRKLLLVCYEGFFCSEIIMHGKLKRWRAVLCR